MFGIIVAAADVVMLLGRALISYFVAGSGHMGGMGVWRVSPLTVREATCVFKALKAPAFAAQVLALAEEVCTWRRAAGGVEGGSGDGGGLVVALTRLAFSRDDSQRADAVAYTTHVRTHAARGAHGTNAHIGGRTREELPYGVTHSHMPHA